jgi:hypothetical protein
MQKKYLFIPIVLLHLLLLIYLKFTAWPEMTLWPYLITKGWLPYRDIAVAHTPLMLTVLALFYKIVGVGIVQLKIFTWVIVLGLDLLVYKIVKKLWNTKTALIALSVFAFWQLIFEGNGLWFDLFMGIFTLCSYLFIQKKNYFWSGVLIALAFISKQTAVWFLMPIGFSLIKDYRIKIKELGHFVSGSLVVLVAFTFALWLFRILPDFYGWAIRFGVFVLPHSQGQVQLPDIKNLLVSGFPFLIFVPLFFNQKSKFYNLSLWTLAGALGAYPRFEYFHFQPAIPFLAMATASFFTNAIWKNPLTKIFAIIYIIGSLYLFGGFFMRNFNEGTRFYEQDVQDVVYYVKSNTSSNEKIFVMNWWDNIYALSDRLPAVDPLVPQLSWYMELSGIQDKMVSDLEISKPSMIILNEYTDIGLSAYIPQKVHDYVTANYKLKEKIDGIEVLIQK